MTGGMSAGVMVQDAMQTILLIDAVFFLMRFGVELNCDSVKSHEIYKKEALAFMRSLKRNESWL